MTSEKSMKRLLLLALLTAAGTATADSVLLGKNLIGKGASSASAREAGGEPAQLDRIEGDDSSPPMEIWTYRQEGRNVTLWIVADTVVKAAEERRAAASTVQAPAGGARVTGVN